MEAKKCTLVNKIDPCWFTHTSSAALQSLDFVLQRRQPPMHLRELVFETNNDREIDFSGPGLIQSADAVVVEVCTLRSIVIEGFEVNVHRFRKALSNEDPRCEKSIQTTQNARSIRKDLLEIQQRTNKPVILIDHIATTGVPKIDEARAKLTRELDRSVEGTSISFFRTADALYGRRSDTVLDGPNHYKKEFERELGQMIVEFVSSKLRFHNHDVSTLQLNQMSI